VRLFGCKSDTVNSWSAPGEPVGDRLWLKADLLFALESDGTRVDGVGTLGGARCEPRHERLESTKMAASQLCGGIHVGRVDTSAEHSEHLTSRFRRVTLAEHDAVRLSLAERHMDSVADAYGDVIRYQIAQRAEALRVVHEHVRAVPDGSV
jgi:hypothetical protein